MRSRFAYVLFVRHRARILTGLFLQDYLQERLGREMSEQGFSDLPFRFAEISKVLLDVCVARS